MNEFETMQNLAETIDVINRERAESMKHFNPFNDPILVMKVIEKKSYKIMRPWIGAMQKNKELSQQRRTAVYEPVPPTEKEISRNDTHMMATGPLDHFTFVDPDQIEQRTNLPVWRKFKKGEIFLATKDPAIHMEYHDFAVPMPYYKNEVNPETGEQRFEWAETDEIISDEKGILIPKYHGRYAVENFTVEGLATKINFLRMELESLKEIKKNG